MKKYHFSFLVKFTVSLLLIGVLIGVLFFYLYKPDLSVSIESFKELVSSTHQNTFLPSIVLISAIFILSLSIIGLPVVIFSIFYEGLSIGFTLGLFLYNYKFKGLLFYLLYLLSSKLVFITLLILFSIMSMRYIKKIIESFIAKKKENINHTIIYYFYGFITVLLVTLLNSTLVYFISNRLTCLFIGLIS